MSSGALREKYRKSDSVRAVPYLSSFFPHITLSSIVKFGYMSPWLEVFIRLCSVIVAPAPLGAAFRRWLFLCCTSAALLAVAYPSRAQSTTNWSRNTYGEIGMLDMPSARMAPDGQVAFSFGAVGDAQRFSLAFQALPWLETAFRYSHFSPAPYSYDRSFSLKARLLNEEEDFADLSVGIRDLLGTGTYAAEYVVMSKRIGAVDLTLGAGWGRLADSGALPNPLAQIFPSFRQRADYTPTGGTVNFGQFFHGERTGLFGGATWYTPVEGLTLTAEYSSDRYTREQSDVPRLFTFRSPVNLGVAYRLNDTLSLNAGWYYGTTYGLTLTLAGNPFTTASSAERIGPAVLPKTVRSDEQQRVAVGALARRNRPQAVKSAGDFQSLQYTLFSSGEGVRDISLSGIILTVNANGESNLAAKCGRIAGLAAGTGVPFRTVALVDFETAGSAVTLCETSSIPPTQPRIQKSDFEQRVGASMTKQGLTLVSASSNGSEANVYYENHTYQMESQAAGRIIRVLMREADPMVEAFHLYPLIDGVATQEIEVVRSTLERLPATPNAVEVSQAVVLEAAPVTSAGLSRATRLRYPQFDWNIAPILSNQFFDPEEPLGFRLLANIDASLSLAPGLAVGVSANSAIFNTFNLGRASDSLLPHVRTDQNLYQEEGAHGISYLGINYLRKWRPEIYVSVKAGYLEDMYAGVGGEILWRPQGSRFAVGMDAYQVWKRDFNRLFGLQNYQILTGHVSVYYDSPFYDLNFSVHAGRYLAGDYGATFEISRHFNSGVEIGAFATFTNVPASQFGEGSFDKGIMLRMPLEWMIPIFTRASYDLNLKSLTRDGGQRLLNDDALYYQTRPTSVGDLSRRIEDIAAP
jgi:hypothetical protein